MTIDDGDEPPGFAPADLSDGREPFEWTSRYKEKSARAAIRIEAAYLAGLLCGIPIVLVVVWLGTPAAWLAIDGAQFAQLAVFLNAWLAGTLGGAVFSMKWLYHNVGHGTWHRDRRLWRIFTPLVSGSVSFALIALATSGIFTALDARTLRSPSAVVGFGFLLGYFSDNTIAKLAVIASRLLGDERKPDQ